MMYSTDANASAALGLVEHREEDAGQDLVDQHDQRERAEVVPEVEVLRRVVLGHVRGTSEREPRQAILDPASAVLRMQANTLCPLRGSFRIHADHGSCVSSRNLYGGTARFAGAGTPS